MPRLVHIVLFSGADGDWIVGVFSSLAKAKAKAEEDPHYFVEEWRVL